MQYLHLGIEGVEPDNLSEAPYNTNLLKLPLCSGQHFSVNIPMLSSLLPELGSSHSEIFTTYL